jgi:flavin reductase (DIM6/NTAB) family NADH-FMN oxidoreductase RutF
VLRPFKTLTTLDLSSLAPAAIYRLMIDCIVPRPIAFVTTVSPDGIGNLAPFSFFNGVGSAPPTLVFSVTRKRDGSKKDTLVNIEANRQFVVNLASEWMAEPMHHTSASYPYGVDEMQKVGLTPLPSVRIAPPRVFESPVQMECELHSTVEVGDGTAGGATLIIGKILLIHVADTAYRDGRVHVEDIQPLSRLGGDAYARVSGVFDIPRPKLPTSP